MIDLMVIDTETGIGEPSSIPAVAVCVHYVPIFL